MTWIGNSCSLSRHGLQDDFLQFHFSPSSRARALGPSGGDPPRTSATPCQSRLYSDSAGGGDNPRSRACLDVQSTSAWHARTHEMFAKAVGEKVREIHLFLPDEPGVRVSTADRKVHCRADRGRGCDLNRPNFVSLLLMVDFAGVPKLHHGPSRRPVAVQKTTTTSCRKCGTILEDVLHEFAAFAQAKLVSRKSMRVPMPDVALSYSSSRTVPQVLQRRCPRSNLVLDSVDRKVLRPSMGQTSWRRS